MWKKHGNTLQGKSKNFEVKVKDLMEGNSLRSLKKGDAQFKASNKSAYDFSFPDRVPLFCGAEIVESA